MPKAYLSDLELKLKLRREVLSRTLAVGRYYIPFCGPGQIVRHLNLPPAQITAVDTDIAMIRLWAGFAPEATCYRAPAQTFKRWGDAPFAYADFDAFGLTGWAALDNFLRNAPLCSEVGIAITDGHYESYLRYNRALDWETLKLGEENEQRAIEQHENFLREAAIWLYHHPRVKQPEFGAEELSRTDTKLWHAGFVVSIKETFSEPGATATSSPEWPYRTLAGDQALTGLKSIGDLLEEKKPQS